MTRWIWSLALLTALLVPAAARARPSKTSDVAFASLRFTQDLIDQDDREKVWRRLVEVLDHRAGLGAAKGLKYSVELSNRELYARKNRVRYVISVTVESAEPAMMKGWTARLSLFDARHASEGTQSLEASCAQCDLGIFLLNELPALADELTHAKTGEAQ